MAKEVLFRSRITLQDYVMTMMNKSLAYRRAKHYEYDETAPKIYILESDFSPPSAGSFAVMKESLNNWSKAISVKEAEPGVLIEAKVKTSSGYFHMYFDFELFSPYKRFVAVFSFGSSNYSDAAINSLVDSAIGIDCVWFDNRVYEQITESVGQKFRVYDHTDSRSYSVFESRSTSAKLRPLLRRISETLRFELPIYSDRFWRQGESDYTTLDAYYNGKLVFWGEDFSFIVEKAKALQQEYNHSLEKLNAFVAKEPVFKEEPSIRMDLDDLPQPIRITFDRSIDVHEVASYVLAGIRPFRMFGVPFEEREDYLYSYAFDKHTGNPIGLELKPNEAVLYLYPGGCVNTVKRFFRNFQEYVEPKASLVLEENSV